MFLPFVIVLLSTDWNVDFGPGEHELHFRDENTIKIKGSRGPDSFAKQNHQSCLHFWGNEKYTFMFTLISRGNLEFLLFIGEYPYCEHYFEILFPLSISPAHFLNERKHGDEG